jgi:hypothetical protein
LDSRRLRSKSNYSRAFLRLVALLAGEDEQRAKRLYGEKFPLLGPAAKLPSALIKAIARVSWYRLTPSRIYFIDNSQGFGHRDRIELG